MKNINSVIEQYRGFEIHHNLLTKEAIVFKDGQPIMGTASDETPAGKDCVAKAKEKIDKRLSA